MLPPAWPRTGRPNNDQRRIIAGILRVWRTGASWRGLPERHGPVGMVSSRLYRWHEAGVRDQVPAVLLRAEGSGKPIAAVPTAGQRHEQGAVRRQGRDRPRLRPRRVAGDKCRG